MTAGEDAASFAQGHRSGFVSILGKPNAGKSTLVNALVGEKLLAVSGLPQTTRDRIHAILSTPAMQVVFVDLPGLVAANDRLNEALRQRVLDGLEGVDCVIHLVDPTDPDPVGDDIAGVLAEVRTPVLCAVNKIDTQGPDFDASAWLDALPPPFDRARYRATLALSAARGTGTEELLAAVAGFLPEGPPLYDPDALTDRSMRFLAAELIREKVFHHTHQEIPYSTAVTIEQFEERKKGKWFVSANIHVERDSQKGMVIGKGGAMLKKISHDARTDIERLTGHPIFLELFVKVSHKWRKSEVHLREFGYGLRKKGRC